MGRGLERRSDRRGMPHGPAAGGGDLVVVEVAGNGGPAVAGGVRRDDAVADVFVEHPRVTGGAPTSGLGRSSRSQCEEAEAVAGCTAP